MRPCFGGAPCRSKGLSASALGAPLQYRRAVCFSPIAIEAEDAAETTAKALSGRRSRIQLSAGYRSV